MTNNPVTKIDINGTTVTTKLIDYKVERTFGQTISIATIKFSKLISSLVTIDVGQTLEIWREWADPPTVKIFDGFVEAYSPEGGYMKVIGKDKCSVLVRKEVTYSYDEDIDASAGKISEIFKDLVTTYGGLSADATTIQDSGTVTKIKKFICNHDDIFDRCKKLADVLDWQFYYRADTDKVYFEPKGYTNNTTVIDENYIVEPIKWDFDNTEMINWITVIGAETLIETTEFFNGDASTVNFTLNKKPYTTKVYVSSSLQAGQVEGTSLSADYYVDHEKKRIRFDSAPASGNQNIEVRYAHAIPTPVEDRDEASLVSYGEYRKTVFEPDIRHVTDAEVRAKKIIETYGQPFVSARIKIRNIKTANILVGQKIRINDNVNSVDRWVVINRYVMNYPHKYDEIYVGDKEWRLAEWGAKVMEKIQKLEEEMFKNQDYLLHIVSHNISMDMNVVSLDVWKRGIGSSFVLGHNWTGGIKMGMLGSYSQGTGSIQPLLGDHRTGSALLGSVY